MFRHLNLHVISNVSRFTQNNNLIEDIALIIMNPHYIRLGSNESIRSKKLAEYLFVLINRQITHARKLPV